MHDYLDVRGKPVEQTYPRAGDRNVTWSLAVIPALGRGVTALFTGQPGTGKTALASVLAQVLDASAYQVKVSDDEDDDALSGSGRIAAFRVCQRVLAAAERSLIVFDEIDWDFSDGAKKAIEELSMRPEIRAKDLSDEESARIASQRDDS